MRSCDIHGTDTKGGKEYTLVDLAFWFHHLPHLQFTFRPIDQSMFHFGETQYMTSIIFLAIVSLFSCLILLAVYLVFSFVVCVRTSKPNPNSEKTNKDKVKDKTKHKVIKENPESTDKKRTGIPMGWKITLFIIAILCGFSFLVGFYGVWKVYGGLGSLHNATLDGVNWFKDIKENVGAFDPIDTLSFKSLIKNLQQDIDSLKLIPNVVNELTNGLETTVDYVDKINEVVVKANIPWYNLSQIDVEWIHEDIDSYGNIICGSALAVITILGVVGILFTCGVCNPYLLAIFTLIAIIGIILNAFLVSIGLSASVLVSDLCVDAKPYIKEQLNEWSLYQYLVECPINDSPVSGYIEKAAKFVTSVQESYGKTFLALNTLINTYCGTTNDVFSLGVSLLRNIVPVIDIPHNMSIKCPSNIRKSLTKTLDKINLQMNSYSQLVNTLTNIADCRRINRDLYDALDSICGQINPGVIVVYFNSLFTLICLKVIVFCATYVLITSPVKFHKKILKTISFHKNKKNKK